MRNYPAFAVLFAFLSPAFAQQPDAATATAAKTASTVNPRRVDAGNLYHRCYAVVLLVGTGKRDDPKRPMFAPAPAAAAVNHTGILGFQMIGLSDDKTMAIVEFVAADRATILPILQGAVVAFEKGQAPSAAIESAFQKYKSGFSLANTQPVVVP